MTKGQQPKVPMHAVNVSSDPGASQGARRATEVAPGSAPSPVPPGSDSEVVPRARRRTITNADKRRILQAADLAALAPQKRGPKANTARIEELPIRRDGPEGQSPSS